MNNLKQHIKSVIMTAAPTLWLRWQEYRRPESSEIEVQYLDRLIPHGSVTVDIGANLGLYTRTLEKFSSRVHAFEPLAEMASLVRRTSGRKVTVHEIALSDKEGVAQIHVPRIHGDLSFGIASLNRDVLGAEQVETRTIRLSTLDHCVSDAVSFVKIDVEGHELAALNGSVETIRRCRPIFLVEAEERHVPGAPDAVFRFFEDRDYEGMFIIGNEVRPVSEFDATMLQNPANLTENGGRKPGTYYINNFLFFPREQNGRAKVQAAFSR